MHIGEFKAHQTFMHCPDCNTVYSSKELQKIVPPYSNVGYDVIEFIGRLIFQQHHTLNETISVLEKRNISISSSEVAYLAQKFITYLSIQHQQSSLKFKKQIQQNGGYILHIDGTSQGESPHLISAIDEVSNFVLANVKVPSESNEHIAPFLKEIKHQYGRPLAISSDMGRAFLSAISEVFPDEQHYICHFHFLRDIGKDLLDKQYSIIRNKLKKYGIASQLRYRLNYYFNDKTDTINVAQINEVLETKAYSLAGAKDAQFTKQLCHILLIWVLDGKNHGNGFGFPFDRPHCEFYKRLCLLFQKLKAFQKKISIDKPMTKIIAKIINDLTPLVGDIDCKEAYKTITEKESVFEKLRQSLSIALPTSTIGLNDIGENIKIKSIENQVLGFKEWLNKSKHNHGDNDYQKMIAQIDKYWDKLFCDPIKVYSSDGQPSMIQPQRTNNILEQFFRSIKRAHRRRTGNDSISKKLQSMFADTPLIKNLDNEEYMKIILNGKNSLAEKFAEIDHQKVIAKMEQEKKNETKINPKVKKLIRQRESMNKLLLLIA
ncbi:transposase [Candidatus Dependentiae bacterium]|nr:transposase [Candidatus Dependentiae bacterium]